MVQITVLGGKLSITYLCFNAAIVFCSGMAESARDALRLNDVRETLRLGGAVVRELRAAQFAFCPIEDADRPIILGCMWELLMDDRVPLGTVKEWTGAIMSLLRFCETGSLTLDWEPLLERLQSLYFKKACSSMGSSPEGFGSTCVRLARRARRHFGTDAGLLIWQSLRPGLCLQDMILFRSQVGGLTGLFDRLLVDSLLRV